MTANTTKTTITVDLTPFVNRFITAYKKSAENVIELATVIGETYVTLDKKQFKDFCKKIGYHTRAAYVSKMKTIYGNLGRFKDVMQDLPGNYTTIYDLARMPLEDFEKLVANGGVKPTMKAPKVATEVTQKTPTKNCVVKVTWSTMSTTGLMALQRLLSGFDAQYGCKIEFPKTVQVMEVDPSIQDKLEKALAANDPAAEVAA